MIWSLNTGQTKEQSQLISEELVFPWLDLKRCRQSLYHLPYNHHQLFDNGTLSNLGAENSHRRNISRAAMLLPIFQFFFLQWAIIIYKILIIQSKKLQKYVCSMCLVLMKYECNFYETFVNFQSENLNFWPDMDLKFFVGSMVL